MSSRLLAGVAVICGLGGVLLAMQKFKDNEIQSSAASRPNDAQQITATDAKVGAGDQATDSTGAASVETNHDGPAPQLANIDRVVPVFELSTIESIEFTTETLKGKPWVINFWATWCPPCIEELPSMNAAFAILEPQGVGMLAINAGEGTEAVEKFLTEVAIDFPNVLGNVNTLPNWSIRALPTTIVVDASGNVVYEALGPREWDDPRLLDKVLELL